VSATGTTGSTRGEGAVKSEDISRVNEALKVLSEMKIKAHRYLDIGCNDGEIRRVVAKIVGAKEVYGIDLDKDILESARSKGITVSNLDVSKEMRYRWMTIA